MDDRCRPLANLAKLVANQRPRGMRRRVDDNLCSDLHAAKLACLDIVRDSRGGNVSRIVYPADEL
jgi:hypothetical protein